MKHRGAHTKIPGALKSHTEHNSIIFQCSSSPFVERPQVLVVNSISELPDLFYRTPFRGTLLSDAGGTVR